MSAITVTFCIDADNLGTVTDSHLSELWHIAQANPAPFDDKAACELAGSIAKEIIHRWLIAATLECFTLRPENHSWKVTHPEGGAA